ncbi:MAG: ATP-binding protein [Actinomycetota bacterium]|nr:ATP-binding protein [Actinomycetota bacterium]
MTERRAEFANAPESVARARAFVTACLPDADGPLRFIAALLTSELATNAVRHTATTYTIAVAADDDEVRIGVGDASSVQPVPRSAGLDEYDGRGLKIVDALADRWGIDPGVSGGKQVWVVLYRHVERPGWS